TKYSQSSKAFRDIYQIWRMKSVISHIAFIRPLSNTLDLYRLSRVLRRSSMLPEGTPYRLTPRISSRRALRRPSAVHFIEYQRRHSGTCNATLETCPSKLRSIGVPNRYICKSRTRVLGFLKMQ